jgi:hypothetical protein
MAELILLRYVDGLLLSRGHVLAEWPGYQDKLLFQLAGSTHRAVVLDAFVKVFGARRVPPFLLVISPLGI